MAVNAVHMLRILFCFVAALLLAGPGAAWAQFDGPDVWHPKLVPSDQDTIYVARMKPLVVVGHRSQETASNDRREGAAANQRRTGRKRAKGPKNPEASAQETAGASGTQSTSSRGVLAEGVGAGGLLVDETFTVTGAQFYRAFYDAWSVPEEAASYNFTINVREEPVPRLGSKLTVAVEGTSIYQTRLRPDTRRIARRARRAAQRAVLYLRKYYEPRHVY